MSKQFRADSVASQLLTGYDQLMLAEFKYGLEPKETFGGVLGIDQAVPRKCVASWVWVMSPVLTASDAEHSST